MRLNLSKLAVIAVAGTALLPPTALAMVPRQDGAGSAGAALICGKDYSKNSVSGDYCVRRVPASAPAATPISSQPTRVVVRNQGFSWGDAFAGAGVALAIVLTVAGGATLRRRRRGSSPTPVRGPAVTG
jgi:hypothetical protein